MAMPLDYARSLGEAARDNPVPTALIGMGTLWLMLGGGPAVALRKMGIGESGSATRRADEPSAASTASRLDAAVHDGLDAASRAASGAGTIASRAGSRASESGIDVIATLRDGFADMVERRPLVLGGLGLAAGVGVAAVLPSVAAENGLGDAVGSLKDSVRDGFDAAVSRAREEAKAQGLTPEAASDALSALGDKVSHVAKGAIDDAL